MYVNVDLERILWTAVPWYLKARMVFWLLFCVSPTVDSCE